MITERTSGHSIRGSARRSGLLASQSMSPCAPDSRKLRKYFAASAIAAGSATPTQSKPSASACCFSDSIESELTGNPLKRKSFFVSRTRCSVLHAAPQSRDPRYYHIRRWAPAQQRIASRCAASGARYPSYSEVEIHIGGRRRHARQPFAQQRAERRAGFHPRVPRLCRVVLDPWHVAQIIDRRKVRRGGEVRIGQMVAGQKIPRLRQPADIGQMIAHICLGRTNHIRRRRAAAIFLAHETLVDALGDQGVGDLLEKLLVEPRHQPAHLDALTHRRWQQPPFIHPRAMGFIKIFGYDSGAGDRRLAFRYQHRCGARGVQRKKRLTALPGPLFGQPQFEAVFAERQADEARMRAERMMEQREHAGLEYFARLKNLSTPEAAPTYRSARTRQPVF